MLMVDGGSERAAGAETIHGSTATGYNDLRPIPSFLPSFLGHIALLIYVSFERTSAREIPLCPDD